MYIYMQHALVIFPSLSLSQRGFVEVEWMERKTVHMVGHEGKVRSAHTHLKLLHLHWLFVCTYTQCIYMYMYMYMCT